MVVTIDNSKVIQTKFGELGKEHSNFCFKFEKESKQLELSNIHDKDENIDGWTIKPLQESTVVSLKI